MRLPAAQPGARGATTACAPPERPQPVGSAAQERRRAAGQPSTSGRPGCEAPAAASGRRAALLGGAAAVGALLTGMPQPAHADAERTLKESLGRGLRATRDFLRTRLRADGGAKILAPIRASKQRLQEVEQQLHGLNIYDPQPEAFQAMQRQIRAASLNCFAFEPAEGDSLETRASQLQKTIGFGDACTFRLIAKNVTLLLTGEQEALRQETYRQLNQLVNSYQLLDDMVDRAREGDPGAIERIPDVLQFTLAHVTAFEGCIERCLDLPVSNVAPAAQLPEILGGQQQQQQQQQS